MISLLEENHGNVFGLVERNDLQFDYCGEDCVFRTISASAVFGRHGPRRSSVACCDGKSVWMNIGQAGHGSDHVLYLPESAAVDCMTRSELLRRVCESAPAGVIRVTDVCRCGVCVEFVSDGVLRGAGRVPEWMTVFSPHVIPSDEARPLSLPTCLFHLGSLAAGLQNLHSLGMAHRDPYPFNAGLGSSGAVWLDLNSCEPLNPSSERLDVLAFFHFTVTGALLALGEDGASVLYRCLAWFDDPRPSAVLAKIVNIAALADLWEGGPRQLATRQELRSRYICTLETWSSELHWVQRIGLDHSKTYLDFLWNEGRARQADRNLLLERKRHLLAVNEYARTNADRLKVSELTAWVQELERGKAWLQDHSAELENKVVELEKVVAELREWTGKLQDDAAWHLKEKDRVQGLAEDLRLRWTEVATFVSDFCASAKSVLPDCLHEPLEGAALTENRSSPREALLAVLQSLKASVARAKRDELEVKELRTEMGNLHRAISQLEAARAQTRQEHEVEMIRLQNEREATLSRARNAYEADLARLNSQVDAQAKVIANTSMQLERCQYELDRIHSNVVWRIVARLSGSRRSAKE